MRLQDWIETKLTRLWRYAILLGERLERTLADPPLDEEEERRRRDLEFTFLLPPY